MRPEHRSKDLTHTQSVMENQTVLYLCGRLDAETVARAWQPVSHSIAACSSRELVIDLERIDYMDTAGAAFLAHIEHSNKNRSLSLVNLNPDYDSMVTGMRRIKQTPLPRDIPPPLTGIESRGKQMADLMAEARELITHIGRITLALVQSLKSPGKIRWADTFGIAERAGVDALPIVALISFIVGLVMAFQAAIPMRMFGAELYVANLIGIAMVRELGPLMTAIVLAGRSASAFAAEIGTMRINEEIDALTVMGLDPVKFLIVPRIIASTLMTPLLTVFANLVGILGGAVVITSMGYPIVSYTHQIVSFVTLSDLTGGLIKSVVFGLLIATAGCIRGYRTQTGPSAVGDSTTRAVVTGIILIAVFDGIFSIVYYYLGI